MKSGTNNPLFILTLTTIPSRLISPHQFDIQYCIDSLLNLNYDNYEIHFNIPHTFKLTGEDYVLPEWLIEYGKKYEELKIFRMEDLGSVTKLIPTLKRITDPDQYILVVDDDIVYRENLIEEHLKNRLAWPDRAIGYDGMRSRNEDGTFASHFGDSRDYYYSSNHRNSLVDILQHYKSVSYVRKFFGEDFYDFFDEYGTWCDDKSVSSYLAKNRIPRMVSFYEDDPVATDLKHWHEIVGKSFPIVRTTSHERNEGCNVHRANDNNEDKFKKLYTFLDNGYSQ